jgi:hypothetical protein|tara:strand:+ start:389 stop:565 length:177 start_codon:yes stop_codon:yes gene_type:complete
VVAEEQVVVDHLVVIKVQVVVEKQVTLEEKHVQEQLTLEVVVEQVEHQHKLQVLVDQE